MYYQEIHTESPGKDVGGHTVRRAVNQKCNDLRKKS